MYRWYAHQKGNVVHLIEHFSGRVRRRLDFACSHRIERGDESWKYRGRCDRNIVSAHDYLDLRRERGQATNGSGVGIEIGFRPEEPDGRGVVGVTGKEQTVGAIEQRDRVRRVAGGRDDLQSATAEIESVAVMSVCRDLPRTGCVGLRVKSLRQYATN